MTWKRGTAMEDIHQGKAEGDASMELELEKKKRLSEIANDIRRINISIKEQMYEIGKMLTEAVSILGHGNFQKWIEINCSFSYQTANNFMRVYRYCLGRPELVQTFKPTVLYSICSNSFPEDLREHLFENSEYVINIKSSLIHNICNKFKTKQIDMNSPEIVSLINYNESIDKYSDYDRNIKKNIKELKTIRNFLFDSKSKIVWEKLRDDEKIEILQEDAEELKEILDDIDKVIHKIRPDIIVKKELKPFLKINKSNN